MADAVHFATWDDGTIASSGFSGFPAPLNDGTDNPGNYYLDVPLAQLIKWYWRVKNWKVTSASMSVTGGAVTTSVSAGDFARVGGPSSELDLIQQGVTFTFVKDTMEMDIFSGTVAPAIKNDINLQPSWGIAGTLSAGDMTGSISLRYATIAGLFTPDGTFTGTIDGISFTMYYQITASTGTTSNALTSLVIEPVEFWPYAAADVSPIYNTSTGVQLQDPRN